MNKEAWESDAHKDVANNNNQTASPTTKMEKVGLSPTSNFLSPQIQQEMQQKRDEEYTSHGLGFDPRRKA